MQDAQHVAAVNKGGGHGIWFQHVANYGVNGTHEVDDAVLCRSVFVENPYERLPVDNPSSTAFTHLLNFYRTLESFDTTASKGIAPPKHEQRRMLSFAEESKQKVTKEAVEAAHGFLFSKDRDGVLVGGMVLLVLLLFLRMWRIQL